MTAWKIDHLFHLVPLSPREREVLTFANLVAAFYGEAAPVE